jgi:hypothetical protein
MRVLLKKGRHSFLKGSTHPFPRQTHRLSVPDIYKSSGNVAFAIGGRCVRGDVRSGAARTSKCARTEVCLALALALALALVRDFLLPVTFSREYYGTIAIRSGRRNHKG